MISEGLVRGVQSPARPLRDLLPVGLKADRRAEPARSLGHSGSRTQATGGSSPTRSASSTRVKAEKLEASFELPGQPARPVKRFEIARIEEIGAQEVYDIQTGVGEFLADSLRVHNCFILAVDDTMESILNWYREEGLIFKGGRDRASTSPASGRRRSCSPRAAPPRARSRFMRGADASAGTIKSGGATRRAAKMVVLDVDHPDIEGVRADARPKRSARSACCATRASTWTSTAPTSPRCSTRTPTTRCVSPTSSCARSSRTAQFGLRARMTGDVIETVDAREAVPHDRAGRLGVRRPRHPVRRHDQRLAHLPRVGSHLRVQPLLGVHAPGQQLLQPGLAEPPHLPRLRRPASTRRASRSASS